MLPFSLAGIYLIVLNLAFCNVVVCDVNLAEVMMKSFYFIIKDVSAERVDVVRCFSENIVASQLFANLGRASEWFPV